MQSLINTLNTVSAEYEKLGIEEQVYDFEKHKLFSVVANSTAIEGSTLTDKDVSILIEYNLTAKGKPLEHHLMVLDNYNAMSTALELAKQDMPLSPDLLKKFNSLNLKKTGSIINTVLGNVDMTKGEYRKTAVKSDLLGYYEEASKVPAMVENLCSSISNALEKKNLDIFEKLSISFIAHCDLILIHPWYDGNKRTSRLLMNYLQAAMKLPLTIVHSDDVKDYFSALKIAKDTGNKNPLVRFMTSQHIKTLQTEIDDFKRHLSYN